MSYGLPTVLVTGSAGFIGNAVAHRLLREGWHVIGLDAVTPYYDVRLKEARLRRLLSSNHFVEARIHLEERDAVATLFERYRPSHIIHLAAQAGVRHSLEAPQEYVDANVTGFLNILETARASDIEHLVYASTSSVYGLNARRPFSPHRGAAHPVSFYAATKLANEAMAHSYAHLFRIPTTGLRFFTVYGPWGRPDMALFKFTRAILADEPVELFNAGRMTRDFTYIDDVVESVTRILKQPPTAAPGWDAETADPATSSAPYRIFNVGNGAPIELGRYVRAIEAATGRRATIRAMPFQPGDVMDTWAECEDLAQAIDFRPNTSVEEGVAEFVAWYRAYFKNAVS